MSGKIAILASTNGSDIPALVEVCEKGLLDAQISAVIVNKECGALEFAKSKGLNAVLIPSKGKEREAYDKEVSKVLEESGADLIMLIGYMRYLSPWFVGKYRNRIMNIHPSLLPAFAGGMDTDVHQTVLDHGCKVTGCTLHFVDEGADTGPIIIQKSTDILPGDDALSLKKKIQVLEQEALVQGASLFFAGKLKVKGKVVVIG